MQCSNHGFGSGASFCACAPILSTAMRVPAGKAAETIDRKLLIGKGFMVIWSIKQ